MSDNYALFIVTVPNDCEADHHGPTAEGTLCVPKSQYRRASVDAGLAVLAPTLTPSAVRSTVTSHVKRKSEHDLSSTIQRTFPISICPLLKDYLAEKSDIDAVWLLSDDKKTFQITFYVEFGLVSDRMLRDLANLGIGTRNGTKVFVLPTTVVFRGHEDTRSDNSPSCSTSTVNTSPDADDHASRTTPSIAHELTLSRKIRKRIQESNFKKSVRARLMVHQVVASIRASSAITFDFLLLICLASMLAAFGLLENSTVTIVASMLVSPLMNPILGVVFGLSVRDNSLWRRGLRNEIIGLIVCVSCGFLLGLFTTVLETRWGSSSSFPTPEMKSRGDGKRLWVGVLIALPSGAGVALSVLGGNTGSLVGVAISASLLPPAVNCGLLFAYSLLIRLVPRADTVPFSMNNISDGSLLRCPTYLHNDYRPLYSCNLGNEAAILAGCSLLLTVVNIICIIIMALIILRIKEVVPLHQTDEDIAHFFHHDVPVARDYNKTIQAGDFDPLDLSTLVANRNNLAKSIVDRWRSFKTSSTSHSRQQSNQSPSPPLSLDLESPKHLQHLVAGDTESRRKLVCLHTVAKEYQLDILNPDDYDLTSSDSEEKVRLLVNDLLDMCREIPSVFVDLYRLQPFAAQPVPADREHLSFYRDIIENLPPKWHQLYLVERQRHLLNTWSTPFERTYREPVQASRNFHESLREKTKRTRFRLARQRSEPESKVIAKMINQPATAELPVAGTRFRIAKTTTTADLDGNESALI